MDIPLIQESSTVFIKRTKHSIHKEIIAHREMDMKEIMKSDTI